MAHYHQSRAADTVALGCVGRYCRFQNNNVKYPSVIVDPVRRPAINPRPAMAMGYLPTPGAPESLGCGGGCGCTKCGMSGIPVLDTIADTIRPVFGEATTAVTIGVVALGAYALYKKLR